MYRPYHLIGLELGISALSAVLRNEPTGQTKSFMSDVVSVAKRDLKQGEILDGEGGFTVWGKAQPAAKSLQFGALPIGLAHGVKLMHRFDNTYLRLVLGRPAERGRPFRLRCGQ